MFSSSTPAGFPAPEPLSTEPAPALRRSRSRALPLLVMGVAVPAIFCTVALPAYAYRSGEVVDTGAVSLEEFKVERAQSVEVQAAAVAAPAAKRDSYSATSAAEMQRIALAAAYASYSGPSVADLLKNPPNATYDTGTIVAIAKKYLGTPYVFGGNTPAGFDCSGFTQFVFAHVGIALPHSSSAQGRMTAIDPSAARAGDLVVMDGGGHVGIYLGDGTMIHSPMPGQSVKISKPWGNFWFVRPGA